MLQALPGVIDRIITHRPLSRSAPPRAPALPAADALDELIANAPDFADLDPEEP